MRLEQCVMNDIYAAQYFKLSTLDEIATYVCEKWHIDNGKEVREVYQAIKSIYPHLTEK